MFAKQYALAMKVLLTCFISTIPSCFTFYVDI